MASRRIYIGYVDRAGTPDVAQVSVYRDKWAQGARKFYASGKWGCGKNASSIEGAVRMLVQDMAIITWIGREPDGDAEPQDEPLPHAWSSFRHDAPVRDEFGTNADEYR